VIVFVSQLEIIEEVNGIVKKSTADNSESKLKQITDKLASLEAHTCTCSNTVDENSAPIVMLERQISKNFAEINKMVLDLDIHPISFFPLYSLMQMENLKPDRTELQQLEESLENHFKLISGISQDLVELRHVAQQSNDVSGKYNECSSICIEQLCNPCITSLTAICIVELQQNLRQSVQHTEAAVEAQQSSVLKISKGMQELRRLLAVKADKGEVEQCIHRV
jgi:hypothetical protein